MDIRVSSPNGIVEIYVSTLPDYCPHCHYSLVPNYIFGYVNHDALFASFTCVRNECLKYFVVKYETDFRNTHHLSRYLLGSPLPTEHPDIINKISPSFVNLYSQAEISEQGGLDEICGMGFRKALEFLIKDYIIFKDPTKKDSVEKKLLGDCIKNNIDSQKIKEIASRAAWLGNDETHYVRKWINMDVTHLKQLIQLTTHWIETEYLTDQMINAMPS